MSLFNPTLEINRVVRVHRPDVFPPYTEITETVTRIWLLYDDIHTPVLSSTFIFSTTCFFTALHYIIRCKHWSARSLEQATGHTHSQLFTQLSHAIKTPGLPDEDASVVYGLMFIWTTIGRPPPPELIDRCIKGGCFAASVRFMMETCTDVLTDPTACRGPDFWLTCLGNLTATDYQEGMKALDGGMVPWTMSFLFKLQLQHYDWAQGGRPSSCTIYYISTDVICPRNDRVSD